MSPVSPFKKILDDMDDPRSVICDYVMVSCKTMPLDHPVNSLDYVCKFCDGTKFYTPLVDPSNSDKRALLCKNSLCGTNKGLTNEIGTESPPTTKRSLEWPLFCETSGIGDLFYDLKFDNVHQDQGKINYLLKFCKKPTGIILMQGEPGTGKTFAAMGACELFTRTNFSCIFTRQVNLLDEFLIPSAISGSNILNQVLYTKLLVIDEFGKSKKVNDKFLEYIMGVIDTRIQWSDRGTIITTNLNDEELSQYCGNSLRDRINTGQKFVFKEKTRRKPITL